MVDDVVGGKRRLRALVLSLQNSTLIPDGPLYSCTFRIAADATVGDILPLECGLPQSSGPEPVVPIRCDSGAIDVCDCGPIATPTPTPTATPSRQPDATDSDGCSLVVGGGDAAWPLVVLGLAAMISRYVRRRFRCSSQTSGARPF
jgi:MYXO-CTERM domain-containing protein